MTTKDSSETALEDTTAAIQAVEEALSDLSVSAENEQITAAEDALRDAQEQVDVAAADATTDESAEESAVQAAESAVEQAQTAVEETAAAEEKAALAEVRNIIQPEPPATINILGIYNWVPNSELLQLFLAMCGAGVGTSAGGISAVTTRIGKRDFSPSWLAWHAARPLWSIGTAVIGYAAIRGGLLNVNNSAAALNPFAIFAIGAIFGLNASGSLESIGS